jgi:hypothetical protein
MRFESDLVLHIFYQFEAQEAVSFIVVLIPPKGPAFTLKLASDLSRGCSNWLPISTADPLLESLNFRRGDVNVLDDSTKEIIE